MLLAAELHDIVNVIALVAALGVVLTAAEDLTRREFFADDGIVSWEVLRFTTPPSRFRWVQSCMERLFRASAFVRLMWVKLALAIGLVVATLAYPNLRWGAQVFVWVMPILTGGILASLLLLRRRTAFGLDGSDHMNIVVFLGATLFFVTPAGSVAQVAAVLYIATQSVLSYPVAGIAKLAGPLWRRGEAVPGILSTKIYGSHLIGRLFTFHPRIGRLATWTIVLFECSFVIVLVVNQPAMYAILAIGVLFHAATAVLMGLNGFFFAFVSAYPAVVYANLLLHDVLF